MTKQITISIRGRMALTNMAAPTVGRRLSEEESAALGCISALRAAGLEVHHDINPLERLAARLLDPEDLGHAVSKEVRLTARLALGLPVLEGAAL